jgi:hypothetical protein
MADREENGPDLEQPLDAFPERQIGVSLPAPLDVRLNTLVDRADEAGARTSRKELLAALVLDAPTTARELAELVRKVRVASGKDAAGEDVDAGRMSFAAQIRPGPRPRSRRGRGR